MKDLPSDAKSAGIKDKSVQNSGAIEYAVKSAVDSDINVSRAKNTITKTRDFDAVEAALSDLPSYSLPSESFPDVAYVEYDGDTITVWLENEATRDNWRTVRFFTNLGFQPFDPTCTIGHDECLLAQFA